MQCYTKLDSLLMKELKYLSCYHAIYQFIMQFSPKLCFYSLEPNKKFNQWGIYYPKKP